MFCLINDERMSTVERATNQDPYAVLNLPREPASLTVEQAKYNYKVLARQLHPDKSGARLRREDANAAFQVLTEAYRFVVQEIRSYESASFDLMKRRAADREGAPQPPPPPASTNIDSSDKFGRAKKFDLGRFNAVFETDRLGDPVAPQTEPRRRRRS